MREKGYYWVKISGGPQIAKWDNVLDDGEEPVSERDHWRKEFHWWLAGSEFELEDNEVDVLSPRLEEPK
jgi:hypothetical protein